MAHLLRVPTWLIILVCTFTSFLLAIVFGGTFIKFPTTLPPEQLPPLPSQAQSISGIFSSLPPRPYVRTVGGQLYSYLGPSQSWQLEERSLNLESPDRCSDHNLQVIQEVTGLIISCRLGIASPGGRQFKEWIHENKAWQPEEWPVFLDNGEPCSEKNVRLIEQSAGQIISCRTTTELHFSLDHPANTYSFALAEDRHIWQVVELPLYVGGVLGPVLIILMSSGLILGLIIALIKHMIQATVYLHLEKERKMRQNKYEHFD
jgi:hypothetical protein